MVVKVFCCRRGRLRYIYQKPYNRAVVAMTRSATDHCMTFSPFSFMTAALACVAALPANTTAATATPEYPARPIRVLVGFAPGGSADIIARAVSQKLSDAFKHPVVVDNRSGASGIIAAETAAKANPDGYTLLEATMTTHGIGPNLYTKLPYDVVKD